MVGFNSAKKFGKEKILRPMARQLDQEAVENIGLRRFCKRVKTILKRKDGHESNSKLRFGLAVKGLWHRATRNTDRSRDDGALPRASAECLTNPTATLELPPLPVEVCELEAAKSVPVSASSPPSVPAPASAPVSATTSLPRAARVRSFDRCSNTVPAVPTGDTPARVTAEAPVLVQTELITPSIVKVLVPEDFSTTTKLEKHVPHARIRSSAIVKNPCTVVKSNTLLSPNCSDSHRLSQALTAVEERPAPKPLLLRDQELLSQIETFKFTQLVTHNIIRYISDRKVKLNVMCNNLLNIHLDMERLCMIWSEVTAGSPSTAILEILEPWKRLGRKHAAKLCQDMQRGIERHCDWFDLVAVFRDCSQGLIDPTWWEELDEKLDGMFDLDLGNILSQVEMVQEQYLRVPNEAAPPNAPTCKANQGLREQTSDTRAAHEKHIALIEEPASNKPIIIEAAPFDSPSSTAHVAAPPEDTQYLGTAPHRLHQNSLSSNARTIPSGTLPTRSTQPQRFRVRTNRSIPRPTLLLRTKRSVNASHAVLSVSPSKPRVLNGDLRSASKESKQEMSTDTPTAKASKTLTKVEECAIRQGLMAIRNSSHSRNTTPPQRLVQSTSSSVPRSFSPGSLWRTSPAMYDTTTLPLRVRGVQSFPVRFLRPVVDSEAIRRSQWDRGGASTRRMHRRSDDDGLIAQVIDATDPRTTDLDDGVHAGGVEHPDRSTSGVQSVASDRDVWFEASDSAVMESACR